MPGAVALRDFRPALECFATPYVQWAREGHGIFRRPPCRDLV
jgi:hypothetical protein